MPSKDSPSTGQYLHQLEDHLESALFEKSLARSDPEGAIMLVEWALVRGDEDRADALTGRLESLAADQPQASGLAAAASLSRRMVKHAEDEHEDVAAIGVSRTTVRRREDEPISGRTAASGCHPRKPAKSALGGRPTFGWASLTETDLRIADLVAEGLTNREVAETIFVSRHTVDTHLRHIFRKLNIGSRVQLARLVVESQQTVADYLSAGA
jgi:DNA-binding CsgD family transcriptional regulator